MGDIKYHNWQIRTFSLTSFVLGLSYGQMGASNFSASAQEFTDLQKFIIDRYRKNYPWVVDSLFSPPHAEAIGNLLNEIGQDEAHLINEIGRKLSLLLWVQRQQQKISAECWRVVLFWLWGLGPVSMQFCLPGISDAEIIEMFEMADHLHNISHLPETIDIYRGAALPEHYDGYSWTTNPAVALAYALRGTQGKLRQFTVSFATVKKSDLLAVRHWTIEGVPYDELILRPCASKKNLKRIAFQMPLAIPRGLFESGSLADSIKLITEYRPIPVSAATGNSFLTAAS